MIDLDRKSWASLVPILLVGAAAVVAITFIVGYERHAQSQPAATPPAAPAPATTSPADDASQLEGAAWVKSPMMD